MSDWKQPDTPPVGVRLVWVDVETDWQPSPWLAIYSDGRFWNYQKLDHDITYMVKRWQPCPAPRL